MYLYIYIRIYLYTYSFLHAQALLTIAYERYVLRGELAVHYPVGDRTNKK